MRKNFGVKPWIYPLPVLIIGTYNEDGTANAMNAAWGGIYEEDRVVLCLAETHKTTANIKARGAFTLSFADADNVVASDYVGIVSGNSEPGKLEKAGFHVTKSEFVDAPVIDELPVVMDCQYIKTNEDGNIVGKIINVAVDERVLGENGKPDLSKFRPISFDSANDAYHVLGEKVGDAFKDGLKLK